MPREVTPEGQKPSHCLLTQGLYEKTTQCDGKQSGISCKGGCHKDGRLNRGTR